MNWLNLISSISGFVGTILIFFFGIPRGIRTYGGVIFCTKAESKEKETKLIKEEKSYILKSYAGLILIAISFFIQIISSFKY